MTPREAAAALMARQRTTHGERSGHHQAETAAAAAATHTVSCHMVGDLDGVATYAEATRLLEDVQRRAFEAAKARWLS